jgi:hypothetical protein
LLGEKWKSGEVEKKFEFRGTVCVAKTVKVFSWKDKFVNLGQYLFRGEVEKVVGALGSREVWDIDCQVFSLLDSLCQS